MICAWTVGRLAFVYGALPDRMASHFNFAGRADGYCRKVEFVVGMLLIQIIPWALMAKSIEPSGYPMTSVPHAYYWLAPERRAASLQRVATLLARMGLAVSMLTGAVLELIVHANLTNGSLPRFHWLVIVLFGAFLVVYALQFARSFPRPPAHSRGDAESQ
jgi:uncharacterized membrane protein